MVRKLILLTAIFFGSFHAHAQAGEPINLLDQLKEPLLYDAPDISDQASPGQVAEEFGYSARSRVQAPTNARLQILIDKSVRSSSSPTGQTMEIYLDGYLYYVFDVSTGREKREMPKSGRGYFSKTPTGTYGIYNRRKRHWSRTWRAWMPNAQFIIGGIAIHATSEEHYRELGTRASGGCIRLRLDDSKAVWDLVNEVGVVNTAVTVFDSSRGQRNWMFEMSPVNNIENDPYEKFRGIY